MKTRTCSDTGTGSQIWRYELGDLEPAERERFESHLMVCAACRTEVTRMRSVISVLRPGRAKLLAQLRTEGVTFEALRNESKASWLFRWAGWWAEGRRRWVVVPATAVAAAALMVFIFRSQPSSPYAGFLKFEPLLYERNGARGYEGLGVSDPFREGMDAYCNGDYSEASSRLSRVVRHDPSNEQAWLYLGVSDYLRREARPAIKSLRRAASSAVPGTRDAGQWYLAQAFLLNNQADSALARIGGLDQDSRWWPEADSLVNKLKEAKPQP